MLNINKIMLIATLKISIFRCVMELLIFDATRTFSKSNAATEINAKRIYTNNCNLLKL